MRSPPHSARDYLEPLVRILHATGSSQEELQREFIEICRKLRERPLRVRDSSHLPDLPHVLAHWHTDPDFLDAKGNARPLPLRGKRSLATLVRRVYPGSRVEHVVDALKRNGAIRRTRGLYVPTERSIRFTRREIPAHGLEALRGLLRTLDHNFSSRSRSRRLFERFAVNPRVPVESIGRFETKMRPQALALLFALDAELTRLEREHRPLTRTARVGVGVYFFEEPAYTKPKDRKRRRGR